MDKQSRFFRVAVEGATTDGRVIERSWLTEAAASYNRATYAARVNMEHIRGITADKPFKAYGDVLALKTEEVDIELNGKTEKKLALFAQIEPTDDLVKINADKQKLYTSIEISPNFATTGKAYMVGLAVTDSPASLGTEALSFAALKPVYEARKLDKANLFTAAIEADLVFEDKPASASSETASLFAAATDFFKNFGKAKEPEQPVAPPTPANDNAAFAAQIAEGMGKFGAAIDKLGTDLRADLATLRTDHNTLKASIESTDGNATKRPPATGAGKFTLTDC